MCPEREGEFDVGERALRAVTRPRRPTPAQANHCRPARERPSPRTPWTPWTRYALLAAWLFASVVATGLITALLLVPLDDVATTAYGRVLLGKTALALALSARRRLRRAEGFPQWPVRAEAGVLAVVLALSATLTVLPVPADADRPPRDLPSRASFRRILRRRRTRQRSPCPFCFSGLPPFAGPPPVPAQPFPGPS